MAYALWTNFAGKWGRPLNAKEPIVVQNPPKPHTVCERYEDLSRETLVALLKKRDAEINQLEDRLRVVKDALDTAGAPKADTLVGRIRMWEAEIERLQRRDEELSRFRLRSKLP
jgi:hypothetical protein